jgi:hypothetical protein
MATCQKCSGTNRAEFMVGQQAANSPPSPVTASWRLHVDASIIFRRGVMYTYIAMSQYRTAHLHLG